jgi:hypothetical protein
VIVQVHPVRPAVAGEAGWYNAPKYSTFAPCPKLKIPQHPRRVQNVGPLTVSSIDGQFKGESWKEATTEKSFDSGETLA